VRRHPVRMMEEDEVEIPQLDLSPALWPKKEPPAASVTAAHAPAMAEAAVMPVLATIPRATTQAQAASLLAALSDGGAQRQTVERVGAQVFEPCRADKVQVFALAGLSAVYENSASALAFARSMADSGAKTILVDLDTQHSNIADLMQLPLVPGLTDLLAGSADFSKTIQRDKQSNLQFVRHGSTEFDGAAQLPARMPAITQTLAGIYDVVLLHVGEASPAMLQLAKGCGAVVLTAAAERKRDAVAAAGTLKANGYAHVFILDVEGPMQAAA